MPHAGCANEPPNDLPEKLKYAVKPQSAFLLTLQLFDLAQLVHLVNQVALYGYHCGFRNIVLIEGPFTGGVLQISGLLTGVLNTQEQCFSIRRKPGARQLCIARGRCHPNHLTFIFAIARHHKEAVVFERHIRTVFFVHGASGHVGGDPQIARQVECQVIGAGESAFLSTCQKGGSFKGQ